MIDHAHHHQPDSEPHPAPGSEQTPAQLQQLFEYVLLNQLTIFQSSTDHAQSTKELSKEHQSILHQTLSGALLEASYLGVREVIARQEDEGWIDAPTQNFEVGISEKQTDPLPHSYTEALTQIVSKLAHSDNAHLNLQPELSALLSAILSDGKETKDDRVLHFAKNIRRGADHLGLNGQMQMSTWCSGDRDGTPALKPAETFALASRIRSTNSPEKDVDLSSMKIEFRESAPHVRAALGKLIPQQEVTKILLVSKPYDQCELSERLEVLQHLVQQPEILRNAYICAEGEWEEILSHYASKPHFPFVRAQEKEHDAILEVYRVTQRVSQATEAYAGKIGIALLEDASDALGLYALVQMFGQQGNVDIILQPEAISDSERTLKSIETLYNNPEYRKHLQARGNQQHITCGFSDLTKTGSLAASYLNAKVIQKHIEAAKKFGITVVPHIIPGHEVARGNSSPSLMRKLFRQSNETPLRFTNAGLDAHRKWHITPIQSAKTLRDYLKEKPIGDPGIVPESVWKGISKHYEDLFYKNEKLPDFMNATGTFQLLEELREDSRPYSRDDERFSLETDFNDVRAIPWTWSFLLSGLHYEVMGAAALNDYSAEQLNNWYENSQAFQAYIRGLTYGVLRTDLGQAEKLVHLRPKSASRDRASEFLETIRSEIRQIRNIISACLGARPEGQLTQLDLELIARSRWPEMTREVIHREEKLDSLRAILVEKLAFSNKEKRFLKLLYRGFHIYASSAMSLVYEWDS